ncbi:MAG: hypothetical protein ABJB85_06870 [Nitrososphaerota archaeon]
MFLLTKESNQGDLSHISHLIPEMILFIFVLCALVVGVLGLVGDNSINALPVPANHTLTAKLTDTLKDITSNVSTSIHNDIDKVISDTMDITINNAMSQLSNATILENNDATTVKFQTQLPSNADVSPASLPVSVFGSSKK